MEVNPMVSDDAKQLFATLDVTPIFLDEAARLSVSFLGGIWHISIRIPPGARLGEAFYCSAVTRRLILLRGSPGLRIARGMCMGGYEAKKN